MPAYAYSVYSQTYQALNFEENTRWSDRDWFSNEEVLGIKEKIAQKVLESCALPKHVLEEIVDVCMFVSKVTYEGTISSEHAYDPVIVITDESTTPKKHYDLKSEANNLNALRLIRLEVAKSLDARAKELCKQSMHKKSLSQLSKSFNSIYVSLPEDKPSSNNQTLTIEPEIDQGCKNSF